MKILASKEMTNAQSEIISEIISTSVKHISTFIPLEEVSFNVLLDEKRTVPAYGVGGYGKNAQEIELYLAPNREKDWQTYLPRTIAHELHHVARWRGPGYGTTLAETIISEGLAQHFEATCFPGPPNFFSVCLKDDERKEILNAFISEFHTQKYDWNDHSIWFFGSGKFPFLAGYDLSYYVMGEYLKLNLSSPEKEVNLKPEQLFTLLQKLKSL